ncbi:conserved exported hypothetical protein [Crenothrix polyspora]|uniref:DUF2780 domain-containing protein n=1 Tax=Crenothrix polyspora TaxID=360316 RepID=A0A1R4HG79_9GAMM|nr:DUF2780 domain-containing protein [Crenothrix polyspora]SJM95217.1 conserved exported hypothetical protein [Crenothrix polyspora]
MKTKIALTLSTPFIFSLLTACNTTPVEQPSPTLAGAGQILQQSQQAVGVAQAMQSGSLTDLLMQQTGVSQTQAQGGAGALFQIAKSQMQASAFSKLSQAVPGMGAMLGAAPALQQPSALGSLAGLAGLGGGSGGNMLALASAFQQQGMSPSMIQQFIPVIIQYVQGNAGNGLASSLGSALTGR